MPILRPSLMQPVTGDTEIQYSARELRASLLGSIFSREGVIDLRGGDLRVTQRGQGANMSVDIAAGRAAVFGDDTSDQGAYEVNSTTTLNRSIPAPSQSATRTHRVILQVRDRFENGTWSSNTYDAVILVQSDTAAAAPLPPSAIPLATVTTPPNASSVTNAMIADGRKRASVGTADVRGDFTLVNSYTASDASRPLRWSVDPDGRVMLSGWARWTDINATLNAYQQYRITNELDPEILPGNGSYRDFPGVTSVGFCQYAIMPGNYLSMLFFANVPFKQNQTWVSFDGCTYQL